MAEFNKLSKEKVVYSDSQGSIVLNANLNVFPHPIHPNYIMITDDCNIHETDRAFILDYTKCTKPTALSRNEFINILASIYFNPCFARAKTRYLSSNGDGTGVINFNGNYTTVQKAIYKVDTSIIEINRIVVFINTTGAVNAGSYGNSTTLINGIKAVIETQAGVEIKNITSAKNIKTNGDYSQLGFIVSDISFGTGLNYLQAIIDFNQIGMPLYVKAGEQLALFFQDNFTNLVNHTFLIYANSIE